MNKEILLIRENCEFNGIDIENLVKECFNCQEVTVDDVGDIRIAVPQSGHWLSEDEKEKFVLWAKRRESPTWGGQREGAGRPSTGRVKKNFYVTEDEYTKLKEYLEELRKQSGERNG